MKTHKRFFGAIAFVILLGLLAAGWPASAQDPPAKVLTLQYSAAPTMPITMESVEDTFLLKVNPVGTVTGDLEGTFSQLITQVDPGLPNPPEANLLQQVATFFTIETDEGTIEGYYLGAFYFPEETFPDAVMQQHGHVLSVTTAYVDLYMAEVYFHGIVDFEEVDGVMTPLGDSGTLVIAPQ